MQGPLSWNQTSLHSKGRIKRRNVKDKERCPDLLAAHTERAERRVGVWICAYIQNQMVAAAVCLFVCEYTAPHVYHNCIQMMLMGLVRRLKETGALFASDIKVGSERSSLLQSQQEEEPMHNAPLWTENIRAVRLLTLLTASIPLPQSPLCLTATMRRGRPVGGGQIEKKSHYCLNMQSVCRLQ